MIKVLLVSIFLSLVAKAEYNYTYNGNQFYYSSDSKFIISEFRGNPRIFETTTGAKIKELPSAAETVACPLSNYGLVAYQQIPQANTQISHQVLHSFDVDFVGYQKIDLGFIDYEYQYPKAICDLDSNRLIVYSDLTSTNTNFPPRKLKIFNGTSKAIEEYLLPKYYWESVDIFDIAISEEQDLIAIYSSYQSHAGEKIEVRKLSSGSLLYVIEDWKKQTGSSKRLKFTDRGHRLIFDNRAIYDSLSGRRIYEAPTPDPALFIDSVMIPMGNGQYLYLVAGTAYRIYLVDENSKSERLVRTISKNLVGNAINSFSISKKKDEMVFITFYGVYTLNFGTGALKEIKVSDPSGGYIMYASEEQSLMYLDKSQNQILKASN